MIGKSGLIDTYYMYQSIFINNISSFEIFNEHDEGINGSSQKLSKMNSAKASLGEHIERTSLYKNTIFKRQKKIPAFNVKNFKTTFVDFKYVNLSFNDSFFFNDDEDMDYYYNDSSGVGSHIYSDEALKSGFFEFIERQSLVYSFLTKNPGKVIPEAYLHSKEIICIYNLVLNYFEEVEIYEISFFEDVFVVLSKSLKGKRIGMGLSASTDIHDAIRKSLEELLSCSLKNLPYKYGNLDRSLQEQIEVKENDPHYYSNYFFSVMDTEELDQSYKYLGEGKVKFEEKSGPRSNNIIEIMSRFSNKYNIDLLIIFIPVENISYPNKVLKVWSKDAFPHILNQRIKPDLYSLAKNIEGRVKFPNEGKYLPFP
ncbi:YcaO-like family protein [Macrococcoides caseolyticum]|nr:hypothetical protein [Macrococcus caseolyticus]RKO13998.1 hypothetical protein D6861_08755 [Macrococcus caseolyticus]